MILVFQIALFAFIMLSFVMVVGVPVIFAAPSGVQAIRYKRFVFSGVSAWIFLVFLLAILNSFVT